MLASSSILSLAQPLVLNQLKKIAHRFKNKYVLRVVYEEDDAITVITVYPARRERYAEGV